MNGINRFAVVLLAGLCCHSVGAQSLDPATILSPHPSTWPTYSGDYSGRRFSTLNQISQSNVKALSLAWASHVTTGSHSAPSGGYGPAGGGAPVIVGGVGTTEVNAQANIRSTLIQVDGVIYATFPDNAWAIDARDGHELWHYVWKTRGGTHIGNRGVGMWHDRVYMVTPDDYLLCLNAKTGKEIWHREISDFNLQYFSTMAPIVIGDHILIGTGNDLDEPGYLQSLNPETGEMEWRFYTVPMKAGDPGLETWASLDAASHGGGNVWVPGSYDPETHLYIFGSANPSAAYTSQLRGPGDNLYTCSMIAVNVDTGKMAWYYQTSPHDTHDFDSSQTPILVDGPFQGKQRKMAMSMARNGYFFVVDRTTGEHLLTSKISDTVNWASGLNKNGQPVRDPAKDYDIGGALVSPNNQGTTNWPPPSFDPETGLFYVQTADSISMYYLATLDPRGAMGLGGKDELNLGTLGTYLTAIDYQTGKISWQHRYPGVASYGLQNGVLSTAGKLVFAGDAGGNLVAYDPATGKILWHTKIGVSNAPETYMLDGHQYILVAGGDTIYAFTVNN
jgi:alcohol dehydrogenase (cytochrome c)